ncbi:hypothetical protein KPL26_02980 [Clostridium algidicarnis]|uniref:hypothetical protein n=1 Tax=Clostridium algidicarnis TaxID=37659 RepID=UPI001C0AB5A7|nr:hypothetical protein [Clostridium algidicarnis]MBU3195628.1 hypothetical protein [Clostridium algidicarnis]
MEKDIIILRRKDGGALEQFKVTFLNWNYAKRGKRIKYYDIQSENVYEGTIKEVEDNKEYFTVVNSTDALYKNKSIHVSQICELEEL